MEPKHTLKIQKSQSSTDFELAHVRNDFYEAEFLKDLFKQDIPYDKTRTLKFTHRMRNWTNSTRNLFNEKYSHFLRRNEFKSAERNSRSLNNLYSNKASVPKISLDKLEQFNKRRLFARLSTPHSILRSISDDSAIKQNTSVISDALISVNEGYVGQALYQSCTLAFPSLNNDTKYSHLLHRLDETDNQIRGLISGSQSKLTLKSHCKETNAKSNNCPKNFLKNECDSLLYTFKEYSHKLQGLLQLNNKQNYGFIHTSSEQISCYFSEPECLANGECTIAHKQQQLRRFPSLPNINQNATKMSHHLTLPSKRSTKPILQICPSTPTPPESDNSQLSSCNLNNIDNNMLLDSKSYNKSLTIEPTFLVSFPTQSRISSNAFIIPNYEQHICTNISNSNSSSSLLAPCFSVPLSVNEHHTLEMCRHPSCHTNRSSEYHISTSVNNAMTVGMPGITDSPSMKRFASPASAAVVAAGSIAKTNSLYSSENRLSPPSPTKTGVSATPSDSVSTTTSTSTGTTIVPKDVTEIGRRSSDSDLSITPKGNSICVASERLVAATALMRLNQPNNSKTANTTDGGIDMLEYPFLTMSKYPSGFILHLGATVTARSVKLLERVPNPDEPEVRDSWWTELRMEIRSHARALGCNVVLGYAESTTISDDVCVLSATGTAAVINMAYNRSVSQNDIFLISKPTCGSGGSLEDHVPGTEQTSKELTSSFGIIQGSSNLTSQKRFAGPPINALKNSCTTCHIPYNVGSMPFNAKMRKCEICRKGRVPDVLFATLEVPDYLQVTGRGCFLQAQVVRSKKDLRSELNAKEISDGLPFLEYELHRVLINKLKAKGMNAIFGLKTQVAIGERMISLIATGTGLFLTALPMPHVPKIVAGNSWTDKQKLNELQKKLQETFERNQEIYQLKQIDPDFSQSDKQSDTDESDEEIIEIDLNCGNKDTCVLEVDDIEDLEIISLLMEPYPPEGFHVVNTQSVPGIEMEVAKNLQMFTQIWRARLDVGHNMTGFQKHFQRLLQTIYFKLRTMIPCAICDLRFRLDLPDSDQIQLLVSGMALGLGDINKFKYRRKTVNSNGLSYEVASTTNGLTQVSETNGSVLSNKRTFQEEDYIFPLDEDQVAETLTPTSNHPPYGFHSLKLRKASPSRSSSKPTSNLLQKRLFSIRDRHGVDISPLSFIPGGRIEKYLGNLNFFFIRESTSIRENGGISGFVHGFITELLAVVRAHIAALGGNAMVSFYMTELILVDNQHKNQGQCLISIGGDAVLVTLNTEE